MSDEWVVAAAGAVWAGAFLGMPGWATTAAVVSGSAVIAVALRLQMPIVLVAGGLCLSGGLSQMAVDRYVVADPQSFSGPVDLLGLPEDSLFGQRAEAKLPDGRRVFLSVSFGGPSLTHVRVGSTLLVEGTIKPVTPSTWVRSRHVVGTLSAQQLTVVRNGSITWAAPNWLRAQVANASEPLDPNAAALYQGLVIGDDRQQSPAQRAHFRASGLSHLLAVSGQNVAFLLVLVQPLLLRLPSPARIGTAVFVLGLFALVTQAEPSVLRATVTGGLGYWAFQTGRAASGLRLLALATSALVLIDPFIVTSVGFQLSVGASAGILLFAPAIRRILGGPGWVANPAAVTLAAQLAVSPILIATFGPIGLVSLPANLAAGWAAGLVMVWGMSIGLVAGLAPGPLAWLLQQPVGVLLWWIDSVARTTSRLPLPVIGVASGFALLAAMLAASLIATSHRRRIVLCLVAVCACVPPLTVSPRPTQLQGAWFVPGRTSVLVLEPGVRATLVDDLIRNRLINVDVVVLVRGNKSMSRTYAQLRDVLQANTILAPADHQVRGARRLMRTVTLETSFGALVLSPVPSGDQLLVRCAGSCPELERFLT